MLDERLVQAAVSWSKPTAQASQGESTVTPLNSLSAVPGLGGGGPPQAEGPLKAEPGRGRHRGRCRGRPDAGRRACQQQRDGERRGKMSGSPAQARPRFGHIQQAAYDRAPGSITETLNPWLAARPGAKRLASWARDWTPSLA